MGRKSTVYDVYLNAVKEREYNFYMDMLKSEKYTDFVKSMVDAAKEGKEGSTFTFDSGDSPDEIRKKWMFIKHIIKSFKYQFEYKIGLCNNKQYCVSSVHTSVGENSNPKNFCVFWAKHNKGTKQNIIKFILCLALLVSVWALFLANFEYKSEHDFISFIIVCAVIFITICSLGYGYEFGKELYYHYFGWYLILRGIERAGF